MASTYRPSTLKEQSKLSSKEDDWTLPGTGSPVKSRTRHGGNGRPSFFLSAPSSRNRTASFDIVACESFATDEEAEADPIEEDEELVEVQAGSDVEEDDNEAQEEAQEEQDGNNNNEKPPTSRVLLEVDLLQDFFKKHCHCIYCDGPVELTIDTVCLASSLKLTCESCQVDFESNEPSKRTHGRPDNRKRSDDYAINVLYVIGFLSCGDGGVEAARMLGLLGLPNDTTMETRSFPLIEERVGPAIRKLTEDIIQENLHKEVKKSTSEASLLLWEQAQGDPSAFSVATSVARAAMDLNKEETYPKLNVSFDMGWQQRASGHRYNSPSGHALFVGKETRLPIAMIIKSKYCNFCIAWKSNKDNQDFDPPPHQCWKNHNGSSSSMEPQSCLEMLVDLDRKKKVSISMICADDDASTRSLLRWSNADHMKNNNTTEAPKVLVTRGPNKGKKFITRPDKGKLPGDIPEPEFVADPNHRRKGLTGELYKLFSKSVKAKQTITKMDCQRLGRNYGYFIRSLGSIPEEEYLFKAEAVLNHHYDIHTNCNPTWCKRMNMAEQQKEESQRYYRSMSNKADAGLYPVLKEIVDRFTTLERLKEVDHGMDTNINESFNNTASWIAPKNKVYCGSGSLHTRLSVAIGIISLGLVQYFSRLFSELKIEMTPNVLHFLKVKERQRRQRIDKCKTSKYKRTRNKRKFDDMRNYEAIAKKERAKRDGTYQSGQNVASGTVDGYTEEEIAAAAEDSKMPAQKKPRQIPTCSSCGKKGHATSRSKQCIHNIHNSNYIPVFVAQPPQVASMPEQDDLGDLDDVDQLDSIPLTRMEEHSDNAEEEFFECNTFSDEDDDEEEADIRMII